MGILQPLWWHGGGGRGTTYQYLQDLTLYHSPPPLKKKITQRGEQKGHEGYIHPIPTVYVHKGMLPACCRGNHVF